MLLGAVDLGSNSFRVEIGKVEDGRIITQSYWKETVRLAAGFDKNGAITPEMQERALAALSRFKEKLAGLPPAQVRAVGTQALRIAKNSEEFLKKAEEALGYPIDILSGHEEARLVFKGCAHTLPPSDKRRLVVDIGGASTEFVIGRGLEAQRYESFRIGCVNTSIRFFHNGVFTEEKLNKAVVACSAEIAEAAERFGCKQFDEAYGSAGTFGAVADICTAQGWSDGEVRPEHLAKVREMLLKAGDTDHIRFPGLKPERKEVIAGGLSVLTAVFKTLGVKSMRTAAGALRVGLLYEQLGIVQDRDTRDVSVEALMKSSGVNAEHAARVADLTINLLRLFAPSSEVPDIKRIRWAALLHEAGTFVSTSRYHRHGAYIVENADMPGFTRTDQQLMAQFVLAQRGGLGKVEPMLKNDLRARQVLAMRLAVLFAHARRPVKLPMMSLTKNDGMTLSIEQAWLDEYPLTAYLLQQECELWTKFGRRITLKAI